MLRLIFAAALALASPARAATLDGSAVYDPASALWTYSYAVDNTGGSANIGDVAIYVGYWPSEPTGYYAVQPIPAPYTAPAGWTMFGSFSGSICGSPYNECGGFYEFYNQAGGYNTAGSVLPGQIVGGFSITSKYGPTIDGANDFFMYGCIGSNFGACDVQAFGDVITPNGADWRVGQNFSAPLPGSLPLFASGAVLLLWRWRRCSRG